MRAAGLHGRRSELELIRAAALSASTGPAQLVTLVGVAGVGKSALVEAAADDLAASGFRVDRVALSEAETALTWAGLHMLCGGITDDELAQLSPGLREAIPGALGRRPTPAIDAGQVAFAVTELIASRASKGPLAIVIDDGQWLDRASAGALAFAIRANSHLPMLVLTSFRPAHPLPFDPDRLVPADRYQELSLKGLTPAGVHHLLVDRCDVTLGRADLIRVHEATDGVPLYVIESGRLIAGGRDVRDALVPPSVQATIGVRLAELPADTLQVLQLVALCTRPTSELVERAMERLDATIDVAEAMARTDSARLTRWRGGVIEFEHPLVRATIVDSLPAIERRRLQLALAAVVPDADERALLRADAATEPDPDLADDLAIAAERAAAQGASHLAAERFELAAWATPDTARAARGHRFLMAASAADSAGDRALPFRLLDLAEPLLDTPDDQFQLGLTRVLAIARRGELDDASDAARRLLDRSNGSSALRWQVHQLLARISAFSDLDAACEHAAAAVAAAGDGHPSAVRLRVLAIRLALLAGRPVDVAPVATLDVAHDSSLASNATDVMIWSHRLDDALGLAQTALDAARREGDWHMVMNGLDGLADSHARAGNWDAALDYFRQWFELWGMIGGIDASARSAEVAAILASRGELADAQHRVEVAAATTGRSPIEEIHLRSEACRVMVCAADWSAAVAHGRIARQVSAQIGFGDIGVAPFRADLVEALLQVSAIAEAGEVAEEHHRLTERNGFPRGRADAARSRALVAVERSDSELATDLLVRATELHREVGVPLEVGRDLLALGSTLRRAGQRSLAGDRLAEARAVFEGLGATTWVDRTDAELGRLGARRRARGDELTPSESQIAQLATQGRTNSEIARTLSVSVRTVESTLTRVYRKLGVRSRTELVTALARRPEEL